MIWTILLTSDVGLMSLFTILFMVGMAVFLFAYAMRHMASDARQNTAAPLGPHPH